MENFCFPGTRSLKEAGKNLVPGFILDKVRVSYIFKFYSFFSSRLKSVKPANTRFLLTSSVDGSATSESSRQDLRLHKLYEARVSEAGDDVGARG